MNIRILIVDDEPLARKRIRDLLVEEEVEILSDCKNGEEALKAIIQEEPDLVLLDVQMPQMGGFELLEKLSAAQMPMVIFTTAYDQHALRAFEVHAVDYLLKPFKVERFQKALERVRELLADRQQNIATERILAMLGEREKQTKTPSYRTRLTVKTDDKVVLVPIAEVEYFESAGNYVIAATDCKNHILRETLTALEGKLDSKIFLRIGRSALVNADAIREFLPGFKGSYSVVMKSGKVLAMTRGIKEVERLLGE